MDTSEQYIKMRLAAIPDLGMGIPPQKPTHFYTETVWVDAKGDWYYSTANEVVQLERQDQLQEMIGVKSKYQLLDRFNSFYHNLYLGYVCVDDSFTSMEQLWFAFVMRGKYGKIWDGEKWLTT